MRRRPQRLQVSTFPFLAVLLSAMGSLILLLLVLDRQARIVALAKARQAVSRVTEDTEAARRQQEEWERRRQALHDELAQQLGELSLQLEEIQKQGANADRQSQSVQLRIADLDRQIQSERTALSRAEADLHGRRGALAERTEKSEAARKELARLALQLAELERTLAQLKMLRQRDQQTYSLVPYKGRQGDNRRPIYIECAADGLIFHPDRQELDGLYLNPLTIRMEVERRAGLQLTSAAAERKDRPYLMLLVRPDGIGSYYKTLASLDGLTMDFGYEFVDADWVLDFPEAGQPFAPQPWMVQGRGDPLRPAGPIPATSLTGGGMFQETPGAPGSGPNSLRGFAPAATSGFTGRPGGSGPGGSTGGTPGNHQGTGPNSGSGSGSGIAGNPGRPGTPGGFAPGGAAPSLHDGVASAGTPGTSGAPAVGPVGNGSGAALGPPGGFAASTSGGGGSGDGSVKPVGPQGTVGGLAGESASASSAGKPSTEPPQGLGSPASSSCPQCRQQPNVAALQLQLEKQKPKPEIPVPSGVRSGTPGEATDAPNSMNRLMPNVPTDTPPAPPRPLVRKPFIDRDWTIVLECTEDAVIVQLSRQRFREVDLTQPPARNPLVQEVKRLIDRRQALVPAGEPPYKPRIRFLVRPEGLRSYYRAYPAVGSLQLPMERENLRPDEERIRRW